MCGISAIYRFTKISDDDLLKLKKMNRQMSYRGPDGEGYWNDETCAFAHTRLSIIGLSNGAQPLFNEDKSIALICNGEIYNYKELRVRLNDIGHRFNTDSDSEVIIHLYEEYGEDCVKELLGMFAFCLYDMKRQKMFAARDRLGEKTLYFSQLPTGVVLSTELKAILSHYINKPQLNIHSIAEAVRYNYPLNLRDTFIEQIKRLQAGEYVTVDESGVVIKRYWTYSHKPVLSVTKEEAKNEILRLMRDSVEKCLQSEVPVAVLLSGGIDSTAIAKMARDTGREIHVISAGYVGNHAVDERCVAREFAQNNGLVYHEVELDANAFKDIFNEEYAYLDDMAFDVSSMSQYALYKKAKELGFKVLLSGLGGDELFFGYPSCNKLAQSILMRKQHLDLFPWKNKHFDYLRFLLKNWKYILYAGYPNKIDDSSWVDWTYKDYIKFAKDGSTTFNSVEYNFADCDVHQSFSSDATIDTIYDLEIHTFMNTLCLYLADRLGMANSLEVRCPLLDYRLVDYVSHLPINIRYDNTPKGFYKYCLQGIVPDEILYAPKRGFTPPFDFIYEMNDEYTYKKLRSSHKFFNSTAADLLLSKLLNV